METSEKIESISKAMLAAQKEVGKAHKDSKNPFFKSNYADLVSVMDACKEAFNNNGISIVQSVDYNDKDSFLETRLVHESGQYISSRMKLIIGKNDMQGLGSAITYARRYAIQTMCFVGAEDDDGNKNAQQVANNRKQNTPITSKQVERIIKLIKDTGAEPSDQTIAWAKGLTSSAANIQIKNLEDKVQDLENT